MATTRDVSEFLADVRRMGRLPSATASSFSDADLLAFANQEMQTAVVPLLLQVREEYLATWQDFPNLGTEAFVNIATGIPEAIGGKIRMVQYAADNVNFRPLERIEPEREFRLGTSGGQPEGFMLESHLLVLLPTSCNATGTLRVTYFERPADLAPGGFVYYSVPLEVLPFLAQRVVVRCLEAEGDPKAQVAEKTADRMRADLLKVLSPRTEGNSRKVINYNTPGWGRRRY